MESGSCDGIDWVVQKKVVTDCIIFVKCNETFLNNQMKEEKGRFRRLNKQVRN